MQGPTARREFGRTAHSCITNSTKAGDLIADPFAGSGSTLIAADNTDRIGLAIEISPAYCDVIINRWESLDPDNHAILIK